MSRALPDLEGIRVVIADDDRDFRDAIAVLVELVPELAVVGKAATAEEAFRLVEATQADACLIDLFMPGMSGIEAVRKLRALRPELVIIVMTGFDEDEMLEAAHEAGPRPRCGSTGCWTTSASGCGRFASILTRAHRTS
jgi:DNA-binding NarL/FixJ family response regulator